MLFRDILKFTSFGRFIVLPYRFAFIGLPHLMREARAVLRWTFLSKEHYNHTYHLKPLNRKYLDSYIAAVTGHSLEDIQSHSKELELDTCLKNVLIARTRNSKERHNCDLEPRYGRRLGWYALVRATKPRIFVETGVDRGLGTVVIAAALKRNAEEGFPGVVYATDIVPSAGHLIADEYKPFYRLLIGDSIEHLRKFSHQVDVFLHDSDHRAEYEWGELKAIEPKLHANSIVMSDNSQCTDRLYEFAQRSGRSFLFFQDTPQDHWWPGDGIGAAFNGRSRVLFQARLASGEVGRT